MGNHDRGLQRVYAWHGGVRLAGGVTGGTILFMDTYALVNTLYSDLP